MSMQKATNQGNKIWPDTRPPEGFRHGYANPPEPGKVRGALGSAHPGAVEHALKSGSRRITQINESTRAGVRKRIQEAIEQGMTPREAGDYVRSWTGFDEYRAERIARTEMMFSYNAAALGTYQEVGITQVVADDGDEDEECAERHGQVFSVDEADGIQDHPNGTLDWLPIDPGTTATATQLALTEVRPIRDPHIKIGSTPPPKSGWVNQVVPPEPQVPLSGLLPRDPTKPPTPQWARPLPAPAAAAVEPSASTMEPQVARMVDEWMKDSAKEAWEHKRIGGGWPGQSGALIDNKTGNLAFRFPGANGQLTTNGLAPGKTLVKFIPDDLVDPIIPFTDFVEAMQTGGNLRVVSAHGEWLEIMPKGPHPDFNPDMGDFMRRVQGRMAGQGQSFDDAMRLEMKDLTAGRGYIERGTFYVEKPIEPPTALKPAVKVPRAPKAPKPTPGPLPEDAAKRAASRLSDAPRTYKPARDWTEAKGRLEAHGLEMKPGFTMHVDDANELLAAAERLSTEWPEDWANMLRWEVGRSTGDSNAMAAYQGRYLNKSVVTLQESKFRAEGSAYYRRVVDSSRAQGWYTREGYHGSTLIHEFGHVIDYTRNGGTRDLMARWVKEISPRTNTTGWVDWSVKKPAFGDGVSGYGRKKWVENFAEAYVEAMTRPRASWSRPTQVLWRMLHEPTP